MIISASRRTDIPSYYSDWFFRRMEAGFVCTRNPLNPKQVSRISLAQDVVEGIVFCTKNPTPMLDKLHLLNNYPFYFQLSLNTDDKDLGAKQHDVHGHRANPEMRCGYVTFFH